MKNHYFRNQLSGVSHQSTRISPLFTRRGFTLVELLVVLSILTVISSILLANHTRFNSTVLLTSLAYDVALSVREAQVYGVSVRQFSDDFQVGYGVHFSTSNSYAFFADTNANQIYDDGVDSIIRSYSLSRGHAIQSFCGVTSVGVERCSDSETPITFLDVVFFRPDPDAIMKSNEAGTYSRAIITVSAPTGDTRTIEVASTGQISVQNE